MLANKKEDWGTARKKDERTKNLKLKKVGYVTMDTTLDAWRYNQGTYLWEKPKMRPKCFAPAHYYNGIKIEIEVTNIRYP